MPDISYNMQISLHNYTMYVLLPSKYKVGFERGDCWDRKSISMIYNCEGSGLVMFTTRLQRPQH